MLFRSAESIDYTVLDNYRTEYQLEKDDPKEVVSCPYFSTAVYDLTIPMTIDYEGLDSFVILIGLKGSGTLTANGQTVSLNAGETVLIPAAINEVKVNGTVKFLETFV